ncbi:MAG: DUF5110 domain-containing protein [Fimbriimonadaceae bacterium]|nr:DUF5110 domain-containing protein [Fimbriimonadaceae bacterium]
MNDARHFAPLSDVRTWERTTQGVRLRLDGATVTVAVLDLDVLRVEVVPEDRPEAPPQYAVCADVSQMVAPFEVSEDKDKVTLTTSAMVVEIGLAPYRLQVFRPDGSAVLALAKKPRFGSYAGLNDSFAFSRARAKKDMVLGLGERTGTLDRNGRKFQMWNVDILSEGARVEAGWREGDLEPEKDPTSTAFDPYYIAVPFYQVVDQAGRAAGFFVDNVGRATYDFTAPGETCVRFDSGRYVEYVFAGPGLARVLEAYTCLTGRTPCPPLWALGHHQCRWYPYHQDDVVKLADTFRRKEIPCDTLWLDIDHMDGYRVFTWNPKLFPDAPAMLKQLKGKGFRCVTIIDPGVKQEPTYPVYDSGLSEDVFCKTPEGATYIGQVWPGKTAFPDFVLPEARRWWGALNAKHVASGLAGIWNDMNEPATGDVAPYAMRFGRGRFSHATYHNAYALLMAMATVEGLNQAMPDLRTFVLSRAGSAGIQRYAANWLGDNVSCWEHLGMALTMSLGLGLSGQAFVGADIGGFVHDSEGELLARWMQFAALTPFCRNHNDANGVDQYPWSFGPKVEEVCRQALRLRYRLMPYLCACFVQAEQTGVPVMRPLVLEAPADLNLRAVADEFMVGPDLLVAPVVAKGKRRRAVSLPEGLWYDWWDGTPAQGRFTRPAPLDTLPLYARSGSVVPLWPAVPASTDGFEPTSLELRVFPPADDGESTSVFYEDDGLTTAYRQGVRLTTRVTVTRSGRRLRVRLDTTGQPHERWQRSAVRLVFPAPMQVPEVELAHGLGVTEHEVRLPG